MKLNKYFTIAAAALALVACDKNNDDFNIDDTKDTPITIASAGVAELTTRAITDGKLVGATDAPVEIGVFISDGSAEKYNATNVKWSHDASDWTGASPMLYEGVRSNQKIYAYYPYVDATTGSVTVTASEQEDWLVATADDLTSRVVELTMTHALTKLVLKPTFGTELTSQTITSVKVEGMYASGTLNVSGNTWSDLPEANTILAMANNELLVIPMESCTSLPITITMEDARVFKTTINLATVGNKLEAGTQYNIALQIGQDKVTLGSITASPWGYAAGGVLETE
ncbi:MAG: fimbrillin family protein [Bacteroidales bacterium]|nr:fimbrillin family protein [Bacteroidales bacterium]